MKPSMRAQSVMYSLGAHVTAQGPYSNIKQTERSHGINQTLCKSPPQQVQFGRFPCPILAPPPAHHKTISCECHPAAISGGVRGGGYPQKRDGLLAMTCSARRTSPAALRPRAARGRQIRAGERCVHGLGVDFSDPQNLAVRWTQRCPAHQSG